MSKGFAWLGLVFAVFFLAFGLLAADRPKAAVLVFWAVIGVAAVVKLVNAKSKTAP
jgi:hypothetical protein